ncbi:hypothetical protein DFH08DRAFT_1044818 [Mycena albidolilacea]|uniref:DUF6532 domain-containing protein n=1 Tax=Mycena albidolilacea TaxID=1033008 RepID=A0AAD6Z8S7_9AGAR|nr:hypothetical protein DFH08DRAFT_1044818 [Mycena albidolilacea]
MAPPRPKVGPSVDFTTLPTRSTRRQAIDNSPSPPRSEKSSQGRPRASKTAANKKAVWHGAAPVGPKPKDPNATGRKRSASNQQASAKSKARKMDDSAPDLQDTEMAEFPVAPVRSKAKQISDSDDAPAPQAPETRRSHRSDPAQDPAELWDHDVDDADSEKSNGSNDEEHNDFEVEDEEDLQHVPTDVLSRTFAQEARWQNDDGLDADLNDNLGHERPSSRASMSSGYMSVPASEPAADSDESDAEASATFAALSEAAQRVPFAEQRKKKSAENTASVDEPCCLPPRKERGKRDTARDNEKPRFIDTAMSTKPQGSGKLRNNSSAPKVKQEPVEPTVRRQHVGKERQSSPDIISISDSDDDGIQVVDSSSIEIVFRPEDGKVTLKMQHSRVERTVQLGIDFYLGYYLFKITFPGTEQKNIFAKDALLNSAFKLRLFDVMERIKTDTTYRNLLTPLLHGRASSFRLKAKNASDATVMANYALQGNAEVRTGFLITGMRYIYPSSPGPVDPRTGKRGDDVVDTTMPYMAAGIRSTLLLAFFKGSPSVADKYSELFETNKDGRKELPASMAALGGTAVHSSLNEHRTGHHVQSKFEGNAVQEIYDTHILLLDTLRAKGSTVLADLYDIMVAGSRLGSVAAKPMAMEALALLNL